MPDLDEILALSSGGFSRDGNERRKLLDHDDDAVEDILAVDEGLDSASSSTKSVISGTGNAQGLSNSSILNSPYSRHCRQVKDMPNTLTMERNPAQKQRHRFHQQKEKKPRQKVLKTSLKDTTLNDFSVLGSTTSDASTSSTNSTNSEENSTNNTVLAGSLSFIVPTTTSPDESQEQSHTEDSNASNGNLATQINQPLVLIGDITHLEEVDLSISVSLNHVAVSLSTKCPLVMVELLLGRFGGDSNNY